MRKIIALILILSLTCLPCLTRAETAVFAFDKSVTTLFVGDTLRPVLNREGEAAEGEVTYTVSSANRASVSADGVVTGLAKGKVTLTAQVQAEKRTYKASITLNVAVRATEISVSEEKLPLFAPDDPRIAPLMAEPVTLPVLVLSMGKSTKLTASALPKEANDRKVSLTTSDETIVQVKGATLMPKAEGECDLTLASVQNPEITRQYHLLVIQPVTKLRLSGEKTTIVGGQLTLTPDYTPENVSIRSVTWESRNEKVATVDAFGRVTGVSKGVATIKATAADGSGRSASLKVTVRQQPQSITLKESDIVVNMGSKKTLAATVLPKNTNDKSVVWTSSDENVAKVSSRGQITPVAPGSCTITCASAADPSVFTTATVAVHQLVKKVAFADSAVSINVQSQGQVFWSVSPQNATNQAVTFKSANERVATVDANGVIYGVKRGSTTVTITAVDGSKKKDTIKVNVLQPVEGVYLENDTLQVGVDESVSVRAVLEPSDASNRRMTWHSDDPSIATIRGNGTKPTVTGQRWGATSVTGVTEDGGFAVTATINVGNYDRALKVTDLYLQDNRIKIAVLNESNMTITRFNYVIECYDVYGAPLVCCSDGSNRFKGSYAHTLYEGDTTEHGKFYFSSFEQPQHTIGRVVMRITGYSTDTGYSRSIREGRQVEMEFTSGAFIGTTPTPLPVITPPPTAP